MPTIPEEAAFSLIGADDYANWSASAASVSSIQYNQIGAVGSGNTYQVAQDDSMGDSVGTGAPSDDKVPPSLTSRNMDLESLLFENPSDDIFSFMAIEHFSQTNLDCIPPPVGGGVNTMPMAGSLDTLSHPSLSTNLDVPSEVPLETQLNTGKASFSSGDVSAFLLPVVDQLDPPDLDIPRKPCANCELGGYDCKTICEGNYKGYCTSCVALRRACSFGRTSATPVPTNVSFPPNPWPTLGDHPDPILYYEEAGVPLATSSVYKTVSESNTPDTSSAPHSAPLQPKHRTRLSRESVKILKNWVSTHSRHPYPTEEENESLQRLTGLSKTQISNWLANARRRGKIPSHRPSSPNTPGAIDIPRPRRANTPSPFDRHIQQLENIPLQRWANSPPENEPASVIDIARAVNTSNTPGTFSGLESPYSFHFTDDGSNRSLFNGSSNSSFGTSLSSGGVSFASAYSHGSRGSFGSGFSSLGRGRRRRRRRSAPYPGTRCISDEKRDGRVQKSTAKASHTAPPGSTSLTAPLRMFPCTFCTDTFKTKHDWQRHEKSLHLSLERWVCAPQGPISIHPDSKQPCCVFCGEANPDEAHLESHNFAACQERSLSDRTFYRKDHLRQHLRLVHGAKFSGWSMDAWKAATAEIRSRCGFCGIVMDTWSIRIDHLADHFKTGRTMADWKGDWGFDEPVLKLVENSIPPYLIHYEHNSPLPFTAESQPHSSPRNAYQLLRGELAYWLQRQPFDLIGTVDEALRFESCRIIFAADLAAAQPGGDNSSWLRDLILSNEECAQKARLSRIRTQEMGQLSSLSVNGKSSAFETCPLEAALQDFVQGQTLQGLTATDHELQAEAGRVIEMMELQMQADMGQRNGTQAVLEKSVVDFLLRLVQNSTDWLADFRKRAHLPWSDDLEDEAYRPVHDPSSIDASVHDYSRLERGLAEFVRARQTTQSETVDDATLQRQAGLIIYGLDDGQKQTAADDPRWLAAFKNRYLAGPSLHRSNNSDRPAGMGAAGSIESSTNSKENPYTSGYIKPSLFFLNDTNCYRRLVVELTRFVTAAMSPHNPNCHVPSDEELQHQSRCILYDDDDPWNQTAADNAEWLLRFKRDTGILSSDAGPGLPTANKAWDVSQGGSGFAPPYCFPQKPIAPLASAGEDSMGNGSLCLKSFGQSATAADKYLNSFTTRYEKPARVFCSRELENGLAAFVRTAVIERGEAFPSDEAVRAKAKEILGVYPERGTSVDDDGLMAKFKDMVRTEIAKEQETRHLFVQQLLQQPQQQQLPPVMTMTTVAPSALDLNLTGNMGMDEP